MKISSIFILMATTVILAGGCNTDVSETDVSESTLQPVNVSTHKPAKAFEIEFVGVLGHTKLKVVTPDNGCNKSEDGCMRVPTANSGDITFKFQSTQNLPCSENKNSWILSKIELANIEGGFGNPVNPWIVKDFGAKASNGLVWQRTAGQEVTSHTITDLNTLSGDVHYLITAESCDPDKGSISSDPRIINEGGTSN